MENSQKGPNEHLEASKVFDVSHVTAVLTGGGSGIGLMMTQVSRGAQRPVSCLERDADEGTLTLQRLGA